MKRGKNKQLSGIIPGIIGCLLLVSAARADTIWQSEIKLPSCEITKNNCFGHSASIHGDYAIVGALYGDGNEPDCGSAYILKYKGQNWEKQATLTASDGAAYDNFGYSVSINGDYAIVGAPYSSNARGSAYIFTPNDIDPNKWDQQAKLTASDGAIGDNFGFSVSISGDQTIIGAPGSDDSGSDCGSAYIFERQGENWFQQAKLTASDGRSSDCFGNAVSISGDRAIAAAVLDDNGRKLKNCGSTYIFDKPPGGWVNATETAKLYAFDADVDDQFGESVSIFADYIVVGAVYDDDNGGQSGSAYVFKHNGISWLGEAKLTASDGELYDHFGFSVSAGDKRIIVGAVLDDPNGIKNCGSVYIYERCPTADLSGDCLVNFEDFALLASQWLQTNCDQANGCNEADLDRNGEVYWLDLKEFASQWLQYNE